MARLGKAKLIQVVLSAIRSAGWVIAPLSPPGAYPARFTMVRGEQRQNVRVYIWNLSHGGGARRPKHEYRIQITSGIRAFEPEPDGVTLILGWGERFGVFAAFDASLRTGALGTSPSIQISEATLTQARESGGAAQDKGSREYAVAVRPDRLATYVMHHAAVHAGDVSSLIQYSETDADAGHPDDQILDDVIKRDRTFRIGHSEEMAQRRSVLERLDALEREVANLKPPAEGRGHNRPPELLPTDDEPLARHVDIAVRDIRNELEKPAPDVATVARGAKFLRWVATSLKVVKTEAGKLGQQVKEKARERAAGLILTGLLGGVAAPWAKIAHLAELVVTEIIKWLNMII